MSGNHLNPGIAAAWVSILLNSALFAGKYWAGITTESVALIADAWHTLTDSVSSVIVLVGIKIAQRPPDKDRPFGYGNSEFIVSLIVGVLLVMVGFDFLIESIYKFKTGASVEYSTFAIAITAGTILIKEIMAQYSFFVARKIKSKALAADGWHHRSDAFSSVIILIGIFLEPYFWWIDSALGIIVCAIIFHAAFEIIKEAVLPILGEKPNDELLAEIEQLAERVSNRNLHIHHCHIHVYGHHTELTCHICLPGEWDLHKSHAVAEEFERTLKEKTGIYATVHIDPLEAYLDTKSST